MLKLSHTFPIARALAIIVALSAPLVACSSGNSGASDGGTSSAGGGGPGGSGASAEPAEFQGMLEAHNVYRRAVGAGDLGWSSDAAAVAQGWADSLKAKGCPLAHNPDRGPYGENAYSSSGMSPTSKDVVDAWASEKSDYTYGTNTCASGKVCGHYTQIVWAKTTLVGCGKASCGAKQVWICDYSPPGNFTGQKPY